MTFLVKHFICIICFLKVQLNLCTNLFLYLAHTYIIMGVAGSWWWASVICQSTFFYLTIFQLWIVSIQGFSLNFAKTLGRAVDKLLNGSRVNSRRQFIFRKQSSRLFWGNMAFQQNRRCNFSHFLVMVKTGLFFSFFRKSEMLTMKYTIWTEWHTRYEQSTLGGVNFLIIIILIS